MNKDINSFLEELKKTNTSTHVSIYIPSIGDSLKFSTFTTKQHRQIIESSIDNILYKKKFIIAAYDIIKELIVDKNFDVSLFNVIDRDAILFQLRYNFIGYEYKGVDLKHIYDQIKTITYDSLTKVLEYDKFNINLSIPSIQNELDMIKNVNVDLNPSKEKIGSILGDIYIFEIIKYIDSINFGENNISFRNIDESEKKIIVESLTKKMGEDIGEFIQEVKTPFYSLLKVKDKNFDIDAAFFANT